MQGRTHSAQDTGNSDSVHLELPSADVEVVLQFLQEKELFETLLAMEGETGVKYSATFQHLQVGMPQIFRANRRETCSWFSLRASFAGPRGSCSPKSDIAVPGTSPMHVRLC